MLHEKINLTADGSAYLVTYVHDQYTQEWEDVGNWLPDKRPAIIIFPGGGYSYCSDREAEPIAFPFLNAGYCVFTLFYRIGSQSAFPAPLNDAAHAVALVRKNSNKWGIDPNKIAIGGFSAGGNLSSILGTQWHRGIAEKLGYQASEIKPNALILAYAPTLKPEQPYKNLGTMMTNPPLEFASTDYVDSNTPPSFIWHTVHDEKVSVNNSLSFARKCFDNNVPFELHIFEHGRHGLSLNTPLTAYGIQQEINVDTWVPLCINWLNKHFQY